MKAGRMSCLLKYQKYNRKIDIIEELGSGMFETGRDLWICEETIRNSSRISLEGITMLLDGTVSEAKILDFLDMSYDLIDGKI